MKYAAEWGKGLTVVRGLRRQDCPARSGGSGSVVLSGNNFCPKIVRLIEEDGSLNDQFWNEARSVSVYTSVARNIPHCVACPLPSSYWIWEKDPLYVNFPRDQMSEERPRALIDYISLFDVTPERFREQFGIDPATYWFVPPSLLKTIHEEKLPAHVLLIYPVLKGGENLREIIEKSRSKLTPEDGFGFLWEHSLWNPSEVCKLIYHILSAILELYRSGLAHGDVKPANIVRERDGDGYFLTDVGSVHSGSHPSDSVTKEFYSPAAVEIWNDELDRGKRNYGKQNKKLISDGGFEPETKLSAKQLNSLLRRTLMDGYALAGTIYSIAKGHEPDDGSFNHYLVEDKWHCPEITEFFNTLWNVQDLTIAGMQEIVDRLKGKFPPQFHRRKPIKTYGRESEIGFDVEWVDKVDCSFVSHEERMGVTEVQYGKLSEQLNFSGKFNPMLRFYGERNWLEEFPPEAVMQPIIETYSNGGNLVNGIYYVPDDAESGCRPIDFEGYRPCTLDYLLENDKLTEADVKELSALGHRIDGYLTRETRVEMPGRVIRQPLPYPQDIVKVDGRWMIQPFFLGPFWGFETVSIEEYFKLLCGRDNKLTPQNWADLLRYDRGVGILFELMPKNMVRPLAALLETSVEIIDSKSVENRDVKIHFYRFLRHFLRETEKFGKAIYEA